MHAVILAAGRGSRLGNKTSDVPKGMVELDGKPLLEWQHAALRAAGVADITVITGYLGEVIEQHGFQTLENPDWNRGNMVSSLACALDRIQGPLVISYSDIVYGPDCVKVLLEAEFPIALTYDREWLELWQQRFEDPLSDAESFKLNDNGEIIEIGQRAESVSEVQGQFMGLFKLEEEGRKWIEEMLRTEDNARLSLDTTSLLRRLIAEARPINGVPIDGGWCEVDDLEDLTVAEQLVAEGRLTFPRG
jgi:L-glutamine-phosphate cytidylyltransferase